MKKTKELLFSVTKNDCDFQFFRAGGPGGQSQNKTSSACRVKHKESGAVGECRNHKSQGMNKREAFARMTRTDKFKKWVRIKSAGKQKDTIDIEAWVEDQMKPWNLKVELGEDIDK
jgi:protein subunit release factor B